MSTEFILAENIKPVWQQSPKKFAAAHKGLIIYELQELSRMGKLSGLSQFVSAYLKDLPEDLPADVVLDITKWAIFEWENWCLEDVLKEKAPVLA
jgi:hypothetical protein